jgi:hypothetical protein
MYAGMFVSRGDGAEEINEVMKMTAEAAGIGDSNLDEIGIVEIPDDAIWTDQRYDADTQIPAEEDVTVHWLKQGDIVSGKLTAGDHGANVWGNRMCVQTAGTLGDPDASATADVFNAHLFAVHGRDMEATDTWGRVMYNGLGALDAD